MTGNVQEYYYRQDVDYRHGSPHLVHWELHERLVGLLRSTVRDLAEQGLPLKVLEIGAGHGGFTETALAMGCQVTAVEMSEPSVEELRHRFGTNPGLHAVHDPGGDLAAVDDDGFGLVLCVSMLHHIPDYLAFLEVATSRLVEGGALLTAQDPMWYPRHRSAHWADQAGYLTWRLGQGELARGVRTRLRRLRGVIDEANPADMVEYHVVREGVDEDAVLGFARQRFERAELVEYWSNQSRAAQRLGSKTGLRNSFAVAASGYQG